MGCSQLANMDLSSYFKARIALANYSEFGTFKLEKMLELFKLEIPVVQQATVERNGDILFRRATASVYTKTTGKLGISPSLDIYDEDGFDEHYMHDKGIKEFIDGQVDALCVGTPLPGNEYRTEMSTMREVLLDSLREQHSGIFFIDQDFDMLYFELPLLESLVREIDELIVQDALRYGTHHFAVQELENDLILKINTLLRKFKSMVTKAIVAEKTTALSDEPRRCIYLVMPEENEIPGSLKAHVNNEFYSECEKLCKETHLDIIFINDQSPLAKNSQKAISDKFTFELSNIPTMYKHHRALSSSSHNPLEIKPFWLNLN